ncbi:MAG: hypothetical protein ACRC62_13755 [Microcoleus sp.]
MSDTLYLHEDHQIILSTDELLAVRQDGSVEVWDSFGEVFFGSLPRNVGKKDVLFAMSFYHNGLTMGKKIGRREVQLKMQELLGLDNKKGENS